MNRINPLYLLLLSFIIVFISLSMLASEKNLFLSKIEESRLFEKMSVDFIALKKEWFDKNEIKKQINVLTNNSKFRKADIITTFEDKKAVIKLNSQDKNIIESFVNKILNNKFLINKLEISKTSVFVEVSLK